MGKITIKVLERYIVCCIFILHSVQCLANEKDAIATVKSFAQILSEYNISKDLGVCGPKIEQIFDGNKLYNINDEDKEVTISKPNDEQIHFSPLSYLDSYKKEYDVTYSGKKTMSGIPVDVIKMVPVKNNGLKNVTLYVNTPQKKLIKLEQITTSNEVAVIGISDYKENQKLSPNLFSFDKSKYQNYLITEI